MRLLRIALENGGVISPHAVQSNEPLIVMKGPLSEIYTKALDVAYAKTSPLTAQPTVGTPAAAPEQPLGINATSEEGNSPSASKSLLAVESQANDALTAQAVAAAIAPPAELPSAEVTVYGVTQSDVDEGEVVEIVNTMAEAKQAERDFILVIDGTRPGSNSPYSSAPKERLHPLNPALESLVLQMGGQVFHSFDAFLQTRNL